MQLIVLSHAKRAGHEMSRKAAEQIAMRSRGNPRTARTLLFVCRNRSIAKGQDTIEAPSCHETFDYLHIDRQGLRDVDRKLLIHLANSPNGTCAKSRCAGLVHMEVKTFVETVEPYLFNSGYIAVGPRGYEITDDGKKIAEGGMML